MESPKATLAAFANWFFGPLPSSAVTGGGVRADERTLMPASPDVPPSNGLAILLRRLPVHKRVALRLALRRQ